MLAMVLVFTVSAVFHEVAIGVPLHMVRLWAFAGIMLQVTTTTHLPACQLPNCLPAICRECVSTMGFAAVWASSAIMLQVTTATYLPAYQL
jgi:hypothetical protein